MTDDERKLLERCHALPALRAKADNGMVVVQQISDGKVMQFPSENAAQFYLSAYALVPSLFAQIEELQKCSDPALVDSLVQDIAARRLENEKLVARVKMLEDQVVIEVNLRTKAQERTRAVIKSSRVLLEHAKRADALEAELAKTRAERDAAYQRVTDLERAVRYSLTYET